MQVGRRAQPAQPRLVGGVPGVEVEEHVRLGERPARVDELLGDRAQPLEPRRRRRARARRASRRARSGRAAPRRARSAARPARRRRPCREHRTPLVRPSRTVGALRDTPSPSPHQQPRLCPVMLLPWTGGRATSSSSTGIIPGSPRRCSRGSSVTAETSMTGSSVEDAARGRVLDVACGSAPLADRLRGRWLGIDRSAAELGLAHGSRCPPTRLRRGDSHADRAGECRRRDLCHGLDGGAAPRPGSCRACPRTPPRGRLVVVLPASGPLSLADRARYARLLLTLRRRRFTYPGDPKDVDDALERGGFDIVEAQQRAFRYPVDGPDAARLLVDSLYLPAVGRERIDAAVSVTRRWIGTSIGIPLRRVVALRPGS